MTAPVLFTVVVLTSRAQLEVPEEKVAAVLTLLTAVVQTNRPQPGDQRVRDVTAQHSVWAAVLTGSPWPRQYQFSNILDIRCKVGGQKKKNITFFLSYDPWTSI